MPGTLQALLVAVIAVLPGLLYVLSFERVVGSWGVGFADRLLRFVATSAVFQILFAPAVHTLYRRYHEDFGNRVLPLWVWIFPLLYVALPVAMGSAIGAGYLRGSRWSRLVAGDGAAPTAWDWLWIQRPEGSVRLRLKSGTWIAGYFGTRADGRASYAGGFPQDGDLYLSRGLVVDPTDGSFETEGGRPRETGSSILVRWSEVEYLDLID